MKQVLNGISKSWMQQEKEDIAQETYVQKSPSTYSVFRKLIYYIILLHICWCFNMNKW